MKRALVCVSSTVLLLACAASPSSDVGAADPSAAPSSAAPPSVVTPPPSASGAPAATVAQGTLLFGTGAPIRGLAFASGAQHGVTDASGAFTYETGTPLTFRIGDVTIGPVAGADVLSPYQLSGTATCEDTDVVSRVVGLLEALDGDGDPTTGITLSVPPGTAAPTPLAAATDAALVALAGKPLPAKNDALRSFFAVFDAEAWSEKGKDDFELLQAALRGQGVATDGTSWFFSGTTGLERTDASFSSIKTNALAIPLDLVVTGSDHIGDIDVLGGTLYAPIEDKGYKAPKIALYDATTLTAMQVFDIPWALQTQGVPWVAVDGPRKVAYTAEWDPTPVLHVFDLATMVHQRDIPLSRTLSRIQGAKVHAGQLYVSMDDPQKTIAKVLLASGTVIDLFTVGQTDIEEEGLVFLPRPDGTLLHTLDVKSSRKGSELRHHAITKKPLRWAVCP